MENLVPGIDDENVIQDDVEGKIFIGKIFYLVQYLIIIMITDHFSFVISFFECY